MIPVDWGDQSSIYTASGGSNGAHPGPPNWAGGVLNGYPSLQAAWDANLPGVRCSISQAGYGDLSGPTGWAYWGPLVEAGFLPFFFDIAPEELAVEDAVASAADREAFDYATEANKLDHIFAAKHGFQRLVQQFGSREAVVREFLGGLKGLTPSSGTFEETITVDGQNVVVRGAVVKGVVKIGTAFTP